MHMSYLPPTNMSHLLLSEFEVEYAPVLPNPIDVCGLGDDCTPTLDTPSEDNLHRCILCVSQCIVCDHEIGVVWLNVGHNSISDTLLDMERVYNIHCVYMYICQFIPI